jgi:hypothetical protein
LFDGSSDLVVEGGAETFESRHGRGVSGWVLIDQRESLRETVVMCSSAREFRSQLCIGASETFPCVPMLMSIEAGLLSLRAFDIECCTREGVDDLASA